MTGQIHNSIVQATGVGIDSVGAPVPRLYHNACSMNDLGSHVSPADSVGSNRLLQRIFHFLFSFSDSLKKEVSGSWRFRTRDSWLMNKLLNCWALSLLSLHKSENHRKLRTFRFIATYIAVTIHLLTRLTVLELYFVICTVGSRGL